MKKYKIMVFVIGAAILFSIPTILNMVDLLGESHEHIRFKKYDRDIIKNKINKYSKEKEKHIKEQENLISKEEDKKEEEKIPQKETVPPKQTIPPKEVKPPKDDGKKEQGDNLINEVLKIVNNERQKAGVPVIKLSSEVNNVAQKKAQDMVDKNYFAHNSPTYGSPFEMLKKFKVSYRAAGENIAKGQRSANEVMNSWMNSPGHRANILSDNYSHIGIGTAVDKNGVRYWVQMFIGK
ncbi:CAP domain-containing protein [Oceanirhabdus sp. W0125-5]|uniref:CAP domain-containing protein n=1 Tax=Oceanirhabdus sp. W0125-5 TaxID=2999116 RepID=UPI0022F32753|nr:CAP domain-containing protein [Oceanirhabdus sp. W0125-5]WBW97401.1 CAP domain-containing protein [Oceanirhabdus sp. W0125-5]